MADVFQSLDDHFLAVWCGTLLATLLFFGLTHVWNQKRGRYFVDPPKERWLHHESFASGRSLKSIFSRFGGANNCLKIMLTAERLYVRPFFPFLVLGPGIDLVHSIPLEAIVNVRAERKLFGEGFFIRFRRGDGTEREIHLLPKRSREFRTSLAVAMEARNGVRFSSAAAPA